MRYKAAFSISESYMAGLVFLSMWIFDALTIELAKSPAKTSVSLGIKASIFTGTNSS